MENQNSPPQLRSYDEPVDSGQDMVSYEPFMPGAVFMPETSQPNQEITQDLTDGGVLESEYIADKKTLQSQKLSLTNSGPVYGSSNNDLSNGGNKFGLALGFAVVIFIMILTGGVLIFNKTEKTVVHTPVTNVPEQSLSLLDSQTADTLKGLQPQDNAKRLIINADLVTMSSISIYDGVNLGKVTLGQLDKDQVYTLPNSSGVICLDSNNCGFADQNNVVSSIGGLKGVIGIGGNLSLQGNILIASSAAPGITTTLNGRSGDITLQGTANGVQVSASGNVVTLTTAQDINTSSSPSFQTVTLTTAGTQAGNLICDISNNCGYAGGANSFIQNGNSFGSDATLGTNDNTNLVFETNNTVVASFDTAGGLTISDQVPSSVSGYKLYVPYATGMVGGVDPSINVSSLMFVGGFDAGNDQTGIVAGSYSGAGLYGVSVAGTGVKGFSLGSGNNAGVSGVNWSDGYGVLGQGTGIFGSSNAIGVGAFGTQGYGLYATSGGNTSALFQASSYEACFFGCTTVHPTTATVVIKQNETRTENLLEVQLSDATPVLQIAYDGTLTSGTILPNADDTFDLGSATNRWRDLYLGPSTLHIGVDGNDYGVGYDTTASTLLFNSSLNDRDVQVSGDTVASLLYVNAGTDRVGIGTNVPDYTLDVNGSINADNSLLVNGTQVCDSSGCTVDPTVGFIQGGNSFGTTAVIGTNDSNALSFEVNDSEVARFSSNGSLQVNSSGVEGTVEKFRVNTPIVVDNLASAIVSTSATTSKGLVIQGVASQSANLQEWQNSNGGTLSLISSDGNMVVGNSSGQRSEVTADYLWSYNGSDTYGYLDKNKIEFVQSGGETSHYNQESIELFTTDATTDSSSLFMTGHWNDSYLKWNVQHSGKIEWGDGLSALDTNVYRSAANRLQTDDSFIVQTNLGVNNSTAPNRLSVNTLTTPDSLAVVAITTGATTNKGLIVQGVASQSANLQEWQSSTSTILAGVSSAGDLFSGTTAALTNTQLSVVSRTASNVASVARGATSQTADLNQWQSSAGTVLGGVTATGDLFSGISSALVNTQLSVVSRAAGNVGAVVRGAASQAANLQEWQSSAGTVLASVNATGDLTVVSATVNGTLTVNGNATVNGHIITGNSSGSTAIVAGGAAGAGASSSVSGNDTSGKVTITTGTGATTGVLGTVTFAQSFGSAPNIVLTPANGNGSSIQYFAGNSSTTTFTIDANNAPADGSTYTYYYHVMQ